MTMFDPTERKFEIELKLENETTKLKELKENVERSSNLTKGITGILSSFEQRLARLEETILPVYNETGNLQRSQQNIERTLAALDHVIGYYSVAQEVEVTVRSGPFVAGLDEFLAAMQRLQTALHYFEKNNPQSVELENVSSLFNAGGDALNREFKELLLKHSRPVPPITLLDLVAVDEELTTDDASVSSLTQFPEAVGSQLVLMADWLVAQGRDEFMNVYARIRATVLLKSLHQLREQQRSGSGGSVQGVAASPVVRPKKEGTKHENPGKRASHRMKQMFEKKSKKMFLKASQTLESSTGLTLGARRATLHLVEAREDVVDEQEMENYLVCVMALQRLMQHERTLMTGIIPLQHQHQVFQIIIQEALDTIVEDGQNIATRAKRCIGRHDFGAVLVVFPILKQLLNMRPEFERTVEGCDFKIRSQFTNILNTLHLTGAKALEDFIENVRSDTSSGLPKDGTVHELTSNVLVFAEQLLEYMDTIAGVLGQDPAYNNAYLQIPNHNKIDKNKAFLGIYIKKVLSQLNYTLITKSDAYSDVGVKALFRLNNSHHVLKALQRSALLDLVTISEPDCEQTYINMIETHKKAYRESWSKVLHHIMNNDDIVTSAGKLKDKDRNTAKEKFSGFNKEMEEIARTQRGYSIPDVELRESLKRDNKEYILPKYNAFYDKYSTLSFSKNPEKYVKYSPEQVAALLDHFFDVAA
ncbi:exocyst complex component 7 [Macrosteles quadrilineatus]|uniref:exocyst complex component 7 n=1 Tax=Macrosteles quadrilineatus TaxID=74068 RepID=UPI0023E1E2FF|nr:exocyst complex component 7 [Macrosteles quadrilineatus]